MIERVHARMLCVLLSAVSAPALAQTSAQTASDQPPPAGPEQTAGQLESAGDIVVTARRTAENIQSTPVSVVAFGAETLRQATIRDTQDLLIKTPGVFLAGSGGRENTNFSIRGQSKALAGNSAAAVIRVVAELRPSAERLASLLMSRAWLAGW